ncbi:MAG: Bifunctional ligase/repressor BirA [Verrucomicrobia subdivision 3 bacterium]|nr:Bifunctional ligase/repressor BirA [Limisphaerales bacterium]MCS1416543.1 Bifunctional ligase/repressor BirA [Limisphaerales bacterium]
MNSDARILRELYRLGSEGVSGAALAERLGVSRAAVWARVEELRRIGFEIEASPHHGYRLNQSPDLLMGDDLTARLGAVGIVGRQIQVFKETASTNEVAERLARDGVAEGAVVLAEFQSQGRGRLGRQWDSPIGKGILMSVLLRPPLRPPEVTRLTIIGATATVRAIERMTDLRPSIKWPNDVFMGQGKLAGVLTEMSAEPDRVRHVVLGIGLNVNQTPSDFPSALSGLGRTSLRMLIGQALNRAAVAVALIEELDRDYCRVISGGFDDMAGEWQRKCSTLGQQITVSSGGFRIHGRAEAIDSDGALLLRTSSGMVKRIIGGDVSLGKVNLPEAEIVS